jgi:hypothetical protein
MDNIDRIMKEADRLGFGVSYGKYRAAYPNGSGDVLVRPVEPEPAEKPSRICKRCGRTFVAAHGSQAYCSQECRHAAIIERQDAWYKRKKRKEKRLLTISCAECGADFRAVRETQKYCCPECAKEGKRESAAKWRAAHKKGV